MDVFVVEMLVTMVTSLRLTHTDNKLQGIVCVHAHILGSSEPMCLKWTECASFQE